jgi:acetolactate synthase-1/2/3 large subunit
MYTIADQIIRALRCAGVQRLFGMPGGGSSADLIEAAGRARLPFSLAHSETASAFMATGLAEVTGKPGACIATLGPGAASLINGVANAHLDRVPMMVLTDCHTAASAKMQHQSLPQHEMFAPLVKWSARLSVQNVSEILQHAIDVLTSLPGGPVHLDVSTDETSATAESTERQFGEYRIGPSTRGLPGGRDEKIGPQGTTEDDYNSCLEFRSTLSHPVTVESLPVPIDTQKILQKTRRPAFLIGLGGRTMAISVAVRGMCERFGIPALVTYKAKGVVPDQHPWFGGVLTNGALEREVLDNADLFLAIGLDPVELIPRQWSWRQPVIAITAWPMNQHQIPVFGELVGDVVARLREISTFLAPKTDWTESGIRKLKCAQRNRMRPCGQRGEFLAHEVVDAVADEYLGARASVDAGAHMFSVMSMWPAFEPSGVLISNGLSTMGFALPAAIGAALADRSKPTIAFTGDGGLLMCLGELRTAAREALPLRIIVFDDGALSLIKIKHIKSRHLADAVSIGEVDWSAVGSGLGVLTRKADCPEILRACLRETVGHPGPVLIASKIALEPYQANLRALRGVVPAAQ